MSKSSVVRTERRPDVAAEFANMMRACIVAGVDKSVHATLSKINRDEAQTEGSFVLTGDFSDTPIGNVRFVRELSAATKRTIVLFFAESKANGSKFVDLIAALPPKSVHVVITKDEENACERDERLHEEAYARHCQTEMARLLNVSLADEQRSLQTTAGKGLLAAACTMVRGRLTEKLVDASIALQSRGEAFRHLEDFDPSSADAMLRLASACAALGISLEELLITFAHPMA
jgi:hypothetical protein